MPTLDACIAQARTEHDIIVPPAASPPVFDSTHLLQGAREVLIQHGGECYRLRHTRNDKLILTK